MARMDAPPKPMAHIFAGRLMPLTAFDAEALGAFPQGTEFTLTANTKRSLPHHRTYWRALDKAVKATGRWQSREALHTALKVKLGRVEPIFDLRGNVIGMKPDSTAFDAMTQQEFRGFFDEAMAALSEAIGYDALAWMEEA
ncbi:hypothetical protein [Paracoccus sulfuroxidans]|uniref:NinB protein n=1 Tax=Paracoccus sulfuroxidans TaxID=384678 RepID=A0A562NKP2_9RHOB|nr:hypothetical protein [Paracoccus sulfuroxidans]TWI32782.1 hypothetical protein IQ24_02657 [Paracoccus sulfuroxidans]